MDSFKTGEFIKNLRIEKGLTQKELAQALNCTDKAISRWETGKGFPDIVFLAPLAKILGVTVNELLAGEKLSKEELALKSDEVILNTMQEAEINRKKLETIIFLVLFTLPIVALHLVVIFNASIELLICATILSMACCVVAGFLKIKIKFALPLIIVVSFLPLFIIREGIEYFYSFFLLGSLTLFVGFVIICITTALKEVTIRLYKKWKKEDKIIKVLSAVTLAISIVLGAVWLGFHENYTEEIPVVELTNNDETHIDELEYNGTTYYSFNNYVSQNYDKYLERGEVLPRGFPDPILPYNFDDTVDMSVCIEFLPKLAEHQKYYIPKDAYFIYANDSIIKPKIIYVYEDNSYWDWYISEDYDFSMPTTDTHDVVDIRVYEDYHITPKTITDEEKINEILTAKDNREDISKYVTTEEYGKWNWISIRYEDSPYVEVIGSLNDEGIFEYEKTWQEWYEENPYHFYVGK